MNISVRPERRTMQFGPLTMSAQNETEVESLLMSPCWGQTHTGAADQYLLDGHKLLLEHDLDSLPSSDTEGGPKGTIDALDNLLLSSHHHHHHHQHGQQTSLAELKPLPPFTGYTGHLSINGISGHHYHAIAQRLPDDNNNNALSANLNHSATCLSHSGGNAFSQQGGPAFHPHNNASGATAVQQPHTPNSNCSSSTSSVADHNMVSSSTGLPDAGLHAGEDPACLHDVKLFSPDNNSSNNCDGKLYGGGGGGEGCLMGGGGNNNNNSSQGGNNNANNSNSLSSQTQRGHNSHVSGHQQQQQQQQGSHHHQGGQNPHHQHPSLHHHRAADSVSGGGGGGGGLKIYTHESTKELSEYDMSSIEDIAAIIGSAIADTTVPSQLDDPDTNHNNESRDSWMDLDAWIDGACVQQDGGKLVISHHQDALGDYVLPQSPHSMNGGGGGGGGGGGNCANNGNIIQSSPGSTLQNLLTHGYMPLLQNRLQNGPPASKAGEAPSSTSYGGSDLISTSTSPPLVSTTDNIIMGNGVAGGRFMPHSNGMGGQQQQQQQQHQQQHHYQLSMNIKADGLCSPDLLSNNNNNTSTNNNNYPHTTTILGSSPPQSSKLKRSRVPKHKLADASPANNGHLGNGQSHLGGGGGSPLSPSSLGGLNSFQGGGGGDLSGLLGKEKPVHRCNICNRGFLNKSNIKVHLRTHTGEKPFRCDVCSKAFRQKAHLIKHQQIHKRIGRD